MVSKTIEKAYFIFLLLLPFVHFSFVIDPVLIPRQLYLSAFVLVVVLLLFAKKNLQSLPFKNPIYLAIGSYLLLALLSFYNNHFTSESHYVLSKQLVLFSFLIVTIHALYNQLITVNLIIKACIGIGIIAILGAYYHLVEKTIDGEKIVRRVGLIKSFFANKNLLSSVIFLCFPFFFMGLTLSKKVKIVALIGILSALPMLLLLGTRTVFLALLVFALVVLSYYLKNRFGIRKRVIGLSIILLLMLAAFLYQNTKVSKVREIKDKNTIEQYISRISNEKTWVSRTKFWDNSIAMWKEHPILGVGLGNWQVAFPKYGLNQFREFSIVNGTETLQRPHNDFLNILCENGILGLLAYIVIFVIIYYQLFILIKSSKSEIERWNFIFILAGLSGYLMISFFDFPLERIEHQIILMLFFAIITSHYYLQKNIQPESKKGKNVLKYLVITISIYSIIVTSFRFKGEMETVKMYVAKANGKWDETLHHANKAENYFYKVDLTSIPIAWYQGLANFNLNETAESVRHFEKAYQIAPYQIQVLNNLAGSYNFQGDRQKATKYYQKALEISTNFEEARLNLASVYFNEKQYDKAFDIIEKFNINNKNTRYKKYLIPILAKKINAILIQENDLELSSYLGKKITKGKQLYDLYYVAKKNNSSFETEVLALKKEIEKID
jgi:O-antigen ligase